MPESKTSIWEILGLKKKAEKPVEPTLQEILDAQDNNQAVRKPEGVQQMDTDVAQVAVSHKDGSVPS